MRSLIKLGILLSVAVLFLLLVGGFAAAQEEVPDGTAVRINFEVAGQSARQGHYSVQTVGGGEIASWYALDGWEDSGWIETADIGRGTELVQVLYYPGPNTVPTHLLILNHVPDDEYGWLSAGDAHALEVAWPETEQVCWITDGVEYNAYFFRTVDGIVHRTMLDSGAQDVFKPESMFDMPGDGWELWDYTWQETCPGSGTVTYNDFLGADPPYWHFVLSD